MERVRVELVAADYEVSVVVAAEQAERAIAESAPDVLLIAFDDDENTSQLIALARRLRSAPATYALPLIFLFREDGRALRHAALKVGADDYLAQAASGAEVCARLEALFWRAEVGRRNAPVAGDQRLEIDNFLLLLDHIGADANSGARGAVALVGLAEGGATMNDAEAERALAEAHGFFKLNLRRIDGVAFYGPAILLVYLPRMNAADAQSTLSHLREEFSEARPNFDLAAGVAVFPANGVEIEKLIEEAEVSLNSARARDSSTRVVAFGVQDEFGAEVLPAPRVEESRVDNRERTRERARAADAGKRAVQAVREKAQPDASDIPVMPHSKPGATLDGGDGNDGGMRQEVSDAVRQERELRARGVQMPRRLLLAVSDAARMAQVNLLIRSAAYEVRAAFDGQQALSLLRIERPDLLIVDYELHDMNGVEMLKRLRRQSGGRLTPPALLLLPAGHEGVGDKASEVGVRSIINLPYDPAELLNSIRSAGSAD